MFKNTFKKKKVLITGHTGFKGRWLLTWLKNLECDLYGISLKDHNYRFFNQSFSKNIKSFFFDLSQQKKTIRTLKRIKPDFIFHFAAQAIVKTSFSKPSSTWKTNLFGTINILESLRVLNNKCVVLIITSDKCYLNLEIKRGYRETDILGGIDPYSASKAATEIAFNSYYKTYLEKKKNISIATCRAGNVIGGGDFSKDRIIPDCFRAIKEKKKMIIKNPKATRPWQHVLEPLYGYLTLAKNLSKNRKNSGQSFNFGPLHSKHIAVQEIIKLFKSFFKELDFKFKNKNLFYESKLLQLNSNKAKKLLRWKTRLNIKETINFTCRWYQLYLKKNLPEQITLNQIKEYLKHVEKK